MSREGPLKTLSVWGYRGFATQQSLSFAQPNGEPGSGLTVVVGANNAGKSSVTEALRAVCFAQDLTFPEGKRNKRAGDRVELRLQLGNDTHTAVKSAGRGQSATIRDPGLPPELPTSVLALPSRRHFNPHVASANDYARDGYAALMANFSVPRGSPNDAFVHRLFRLQLDRTKRREFDRVLGRVLNPIPQWTIDQNDQNYYFVRFEGPTGHHSSEGMGEGLLNTLFLVDALYDSAPGQAVVVDEPELSLHPVIQRRLCAEFLEYSRTRQLIVATHSPYFVPFEAVPNGATVARVFTNPNGSVIRQLSASVGAELRAFMSDRNNPHVLGLDAREVFFLDDGIILVEGQEDVIYYRRLSEKLNQELAGAFFGWGVGGAPKMTIIAALLRDLGYERVVGILDGNKTDVRDTLQTQYPKFHFFALPSDDVRTKRATPARSEVRGLFDLNGEVRPELASDAGQLLRDVNRVLRGRTLVDASPTDAEPGPTE